jgi:hypothetical protein
VHTRFALHVARVQYGIEVSEGVLAAMPPTDMFAQPPPQADVQAVVDALEELPAYQPHQCAFVHHTRGPWRPGLCVPPCSVCLSVHASPSACLLVCFPASAGQKVCLPLLPCLPAQLTVRLIAPSPFLPACMPDFTHPLKCN